MYPLGNQGIKYNCNHVVYLPSVSLSYNEIIYANTNILKLYFIFSGLTGAFKLQYNHVSLTSTETVKNTQKLQNKFADRDREENTEYWPQY